MAELLAPFLADDRLSPEQLAQFITYLELLLRWNARINLTAVRRSEEIVSRHFGESLFAARHLFPATQSVPSACRLIDIGSGAGFPGLPIKIWAPRVKLALIESRQRKATFLREVVRSLNLAEVEVFMGRAEAFPGPAADVVTLRAVERFDEVLPIAARLVSPAGRLALLIGNSQVARTREPHQPKAHKGGESALSAFRWPDPLPIPRSSARVLLIGTNQGQQDSIQ